MCCCTERSASDVKLLPDVSVASCDTGTEAAAAEQAVKCDEEDESRSTSDVADALPAAVMAEVHDSPSHPSTDTDHQTASPAEDTPVESSEPSSPTHSDEVEVDSNSVVSLPPAVETDVASTDPVAAGD